MCIYLIYCTIVFHVNNYKFYQKIQLSNDTFYSYFVVRSGSIAVVKSFNFTSVFLSYLKFLLFSVFLPFQESSHSVNMTSVDIPTQNSTSLKVPELCYKFIFRQLTFISFTLYSL
jgi:hypothetical protein